MTIRPTSSRPAEPANSAVPFAMCCEDKETMRMRFIAAGPGEDFWTVTQATATSYGCPKQGRPNPPGNRIPGSINGNDANLCSVNAPCRSFARAISQTNAGGEVIALDSGGYGSFTVDRGLTVMAAPGVYAGITATSTDAIVISATALSRGGLRNLLVNTPHVAS